MRVGVPPLLKIGFVQACGLFFSTDLFQGSSVCLNELLSVFSRGSPDDLSRSIIGPFPEGQLMLAFGSALRRTSSYLSI